jgi:hypothetical protein
MLKRRCTRLLVWLLVLLLTLPGGGFAQGDGEAPAVFGQEELDRMLAPIALYPDSLLVQILMASTYPLEVAVAAQWVAVNPDLAGDPLAEALEQKDWDPSVKSLVNFPTVLATMNERLEWTQRLGDAYLAQEEQVMDTVQALREKAHAQGSLRTTEQQNVIVREKEIIIEPAYPNVVHVPVYDPYVVYGPWWYPAYPPYAFYPFGYFPGHSVLFFSTGIFFGAAWGFAWGGFDWRHRHTIIHVHKHVHLNRHIDRRRFATRFATGDDGRGRWRHDPFHRKGVIYRDRVTRERFDRGRSGAGARQEFRGRTLDRGTTGTGAVERPAAVGPRVAPRVAPGREGTAPGGRRVAPDRSGRGSGTDRSLRQERLRPPAPSSGPAPRSVVPQVAPQRPRSAFDRPEGSGGGAGVSSQRGRDSRQRLIAPRPATPSGGGGVRPPGGRRGSGAGPARGRGQGSGDGRSDSGGRRR